MTRDWNLEGMSYAQQIDELAYQDQVVRDLEKRLRDMRIKRQEHTAKYALLQGVKAQRESDLKDLVQQIGGLDAQLDDLLASYYDGAD